MNRVFTLLSTIALAISTSAWASAYKSENSDKQVEYSQMRPDSVPSTEIPPPPAPASSATTELMNAQQLIDQQQKQEVADKREKALNEAKEEEEKAMVHNCEQFRTYLSNLQSKERIKLIDLQGNATLLSQEQREAEIVKANEGIKTYCKEGNQEDLQSTLPSTESKEKETSGKH